MSFLCSIFGHAYGDWMGYYKTRSATHYSSQYNNKCVRMRVCKRCQHEEIQSLDQHEYPPLAKGERLTCKDMKFCVRCDKGEIGAPHKLKDCRCTVCKKKIHDWDGCKCKHCTAVNHEWKGCVCKRCGITTHWLKEGTCKCEKCGQEAHDVQGCRCRRCGAAVHQLSGCTCLRCGEKFHDWDFNGVYNGFFYHCRRCRSYMHCESGNITEI